MGPKSMLLRPLYVLKAWKETFGSPKGLKIRIIILFQFLGLWGEDINEKSEYKRVLVAEKMARKLDSNGSFRIRYYGARLEEVAERMPYSWTLKGIKEDPRGTYVELLVAKKATYYRDIVSGSHSDRAMEKSVAISKLHTANELSIQIMPTKLLRLLTYLSSDPEGQKELESRFY